jgi:hypothetical protein
MTLGLTHPLTKMSTRTISRETKVAGELGWQRYHLHVQVSRNMGASTSWNPQGLSRPVMGFLYLYNMAIYLSVMDVKSRTTEEVLWWSGALMQHSNVQYRLRSQPSTLEKYKTYSVFNPLAPEFSFKF